MQVPDGWKKTHLGELVIESALRNSKGELGEFDLRSVNKFEGMIPMKERVKGKSTDRCKVVKNGWFAYNPMRINIGSICQWQNKHDCLVSPDYVVFRCKDNILDPCFMNQFRQSSSWQNFMNNAGNGSVRVRIYIKDLAPLKLPLPPLPEQQKIAQILSTWDKAIEKLEALIAAKQKRKKALMQLLLTGKKRFAGFEGEWKEIAIRQMGKIVSGGTPDTNIKEYWDGDILWMTPTDVTALKSRFISDTARKITKKGQKDSSATIIPAGSLLVCTRATIGIMSISTTDITTNQGFKNLVPNKSFDVEFLYYLFSHSKDKFIRYACGSTFFELSKKDFEKLTFECPGLQEQQKIASVLSAADTEIQAHQKQLSALKEQKKGLMQQLLIGKKRVKVEAHV